MLSQLLLLVTSFLGADNVLAITDVSVIDVATGKIVPHQTVIVQEKVIATITSGKEADLPADARKVDGAGKFLLPGLWDMHVHFASADYAPLFVANGVVGVRDMHAHLPFMLLPLRKQIAEGRRVGPHIRTAVSMVDGVPPMWSGTLTASNAEEARQAIATLQSKGADLVKVYSGLGPEAFYALCEEAKKAGLPVAGHIPESVSAKDASDAGVRSMEHIFGILTATSAQEESLRKEFVGSIQGVRAAAFYPMLIRAQLKALDSFDEAKAASLFATFAKNQTYQCPTLTVHRMFAELTKPEFTSDERTRFTPAMIKVVWKQTLEWVEPIARNKSDQQRLFEKTKSVVGAMHKAGVPILAGTDTSNPYCMAGFSMHDELALLVECGLSPLAALQSSTLAAARFWNEEDKAGTVAQGKRADLLLLDANPLEAIANTKKINAVIVGGALYDRSALDAMLTKAEQTAAGKKPQS